MLINVTIAVLLLVSTIAGFVCAAPFDEKAQARTSRRRRKYVQRNPQGVTSNDILVMLRSEGVGLDHARGIVAKAQESGVKPFTMWLWLQQFDAEVLGLVISADLSHRELLTHISNGTVPDLAELKSYVASRGLVVAGRRVQVRASGVPVERTSSLRAPSRSGTVGPLTTRTVVLPVYEAGSWTDVPARRGPGRPAAA